MKDPVKREFAEELLSYTDTMVGTVFSSFKGDPTKEAGENLNLLYYVICYVRDDNTK